MYLIFRMSLKLFFHFGYRIPKRRTYKHDPRYVITVKILTDMRYISNILVVHCLFSPVCVSLGSFFLGREEKNPSGNEKKVDICQ